VADAVQAFWQHVDEEAADELVGGEPHASVSIAPLDAVVLPLEGDTLLVVGDQAAVGDDDAVGIARQIGQHRLGPAERPLCVDDPLGLAQRHEINRAPRIAIFDETFARLSTSHTGAVAEKEAALAIFPTSRTMSCASAQKMSKICLRSTQSPSEAGRSLLMTLIGSNHFRLVGLKTSRVKP
jgi:hypothetical protein